MCGENLELSLPYSDEFTKSLRYIYHDSAVRPVAKVCEYLISAYYSKKESEVKFKLLKKHKGRIV